MAKYYIGTAGWSYKDWVPSFYPKGQSKGFDWLQFYSTYFNCVEVNSSYYAYLDPRIVNGWINKLDEAGDFIFTIKLHQDFTHKKSFDQQKIKAVCCNLDLLAKSERLGGQLIQFPYSFAYNDAALKYIAKLKDIFANYTNIVEVRHSSWTNKQAIDTLKELDITLCTIDQPQIGNAITFNPIITNDKAYFRFHGRNNAEWFKNISKENQSYEEQSARYDYLYSPGELLQIQQKIIPLADTVKEIFVIMNNHPGGKAITNALDLIRLLEEKGKVLN